MAAIAVAADKPPMRPKRTKPEDEVDEKVVRRRQQYKFHQRRHRAKQKEKMLTLTNEVRTLLADTEQLSNKRQRLLVDRNCFSSRGTDAGVPARLTMEYFRIFEFGISPNLVQQQETFLRSIMTAQTAGPDYAGVEAVIMLWKRFTDFYVYSRYELLSMSVSALADSTVVVMETNFHIRCCRDGVLALYPGLHYNMEQLQKVINSVLVVPVQYRFEFDSDGIVTWFSADWDLVTALNAIVPLVDAARILADANISKTGQIRSRIEDIRQACTVQDGHGGSTEQQAATVLTSCSRKRDLSVFIQSITLAFPSHLFFSPTCTPSLVVLLSRIGVPASS
ncbi:hypothetical protein PR003_g21851 [Phytophthora rubi]|uniref:BZIP domain-containing protein n=1 Tax=Phytophthora rubi TaxID=129364 RepID=A0A6A4DEH3_9STRA|nr:hypothetical protein PR002_g24357 [Phytophthora rubi]KAE9304038.1 hypothetical protein PR003_g21851 [Phytophthora rubi]